MQIVMKKTSELTPYAHNPRDNAGAVDAVARSIREFGFRNPVIIDKDGVIVAGHTRVLAAKALELLAEIDASEALVHGICSHGYGHCCDVEPIHQMEKVLFAVDELTGLIGAAARMRPSKSVMDMELSSLKKKFKDKKFAAGCSRDIIREGAERLSWTLDEILDKTILAMRSCEAQVAAEHAALCGE